jgi:hypothetical protein
MKPPQAGLIVDPNPLLIQITVSNDTGDIQLATSRDVPGLYVVWVLAQLQAQLATQGLIAAVNTPAQNAGKIVGFDGKRGGA